MENKRELSRCIYYPIIFFLDLLPVFTQKQSYSPFHQHGLQQFLFMAIENFTSFAEFASIPEKKGELKSGCGLV